MASESGAFLALPAQSLSPPGPRSPQAPPPATSPKVNIKPTLATAGPGPSGSNVRTRLLYHVPGVITSIAIDVGALMAASNGGFVELSFRDAVEEVVPRAKGAGKDSVLLSPQRITTISSTPAAPALGSSSVPSIADRFAPPRRNPRYANIIEQLEKKYGGRSSMRSEEAEEEEVEEEEVEEDDKEGEDSSGEGERDGEDEGDDEREGKNASAPGAGEGAAADANGAASGDNGGAPTRNKKKRRRRGENADYYDSDDSFIDDEEIIEKIEVSYRMKAVKTKHSGFFVSSGALETLNPSGGFGLEYSQEGSDGKAAPRKRARVEGGAKKRPAAAATKPPSAASKSAFAAFQIYTEAKGLKFTPRLYKELRVADEVISKNGDSEWFITSLVKLFTPENISRKVLEHKLEKLRARSSGEPEPRNSSLIQAINEASNALLSAVRPMLMTKIASLSSSNSLSSGPTRAELFDLWADLWKDESLLTLFDVMRAKCEEHARVETVKREAAKAAKLERERLEQEQDKSSSNTSAAADANEAGATGAQGSSSSNVTTKPQEAESQPIEERMRHMMLCEISRYVFKEVKYTILSFSFLLVINVTGSSGRFVKQRRKFFLH